MPPALLLSAIVALAGLPSCEKARQLGDRLREKPASTTASTGAIVSQISASEFDAFTRQSGRVVLVDFYADWCGPCRQLGPILENLAREHDGTVALGKLNVDQARELAAKHGVRGIPDVRIFRDGRQVDRFVGALPESELRQRIDKQLAGLPPVSANAAAPAKSKEAQPVIQPMSKDWLPPGMQRR